MPRVLHVVGTRPNFTKIASLVPALRAYPEIDQRLVHTGQHFDAAMSQIFFDELELPAPDRALACGGGSQATQTAAVMVAVERVLLEDEPDLVVVVGDVTSTLAAALAAAKLGVPVAHVESGLRSFDMTMPEEINRLVTDRLSTLLLATCDGAAAQLRREGLPESSIAVVGDLAIDTLLRHREAAPWTATREALDLDDRGYAVLTLHRQGTVDHPDRLRALLDRLRVVSRHLPVIFPVHPRTAQRLSACGLDPGAFGLRAIAPLGYRAFVALMDHAACVLTDSGGMQAETTALGVACFTLRDNTERPATVTHGTNALVMADGRGLDAAFAEWQRTGAARPASVSSLWDGDAGRRSAAAIAACLP